MIVGIDLGTTNSAVALWRDGVAELVPNALGELLTPSAVSIDASGQSWVGAAALDRMATHPAQTATSFKRMMGTAATAMLGKRAYKAEELSAMVLAQLAAYDAVFDRALAEAEQQRLSGLTALLVQRGLDLQAQAPGEPADAEAWPLVGWRATFWADVQRLLRAELDLRLQPVLGLLEALNDACESAALRSAKSQRAGE